MGVHIDENLSWLPHISHICLRISKSIAIIYRSRFYLSSKSKLALYYSLVYPYLSYCNITWSSTYVTNLNRIFILQKRAVRVLINSDFRAHSAPLFLQLKILHIFKLNAFHVANRMNASGFRDLWARVMFWKFSKLRRVQFENLEDVGRWITCLYLYTFIFNFYDDQGEPFCETVYAHYSAALSH